VLSKQVLPQSTQPVLQRSDVWVLRTSTVAHATLKHCPTRPTRLRVQWTRRSSSAKHTRHGGRARRPRGRFAATHRIPLAEWTDDSQHFPSRFGSVGKAHVCTHLSARPACSDKIEQRQVRNVFTNKDRRGSGCCSAGQLEARAENVDRDTSDCESVIAAISDHGSRVSSACCSRSSFWVHR
jgi:hypothetical protein